ncbi:MAG: glucosamine-6-phosphate deaminase [Sumerlaeia bacterium]
MPNYIHVHVYPNPEEVATNAAERIADFVREKPNAVLGLATGSTPEATYRKLIEAYHQGLDFSHVTTFNLDEYAGLPTDHRQSYRTFMEERLFKHLNIRPWNTHILDGTTPFPAFECAAFEQKIQARGGVDLWVLGIGQNGHIAFNEPGSPVDSRTRLVALSPSTIAANSDGRFFHDRREVPRCALTAGIGTIREARQLLLLATGEKKAPAIASAVKGEFTTDVPASLLQDHRNCTFMLDAEAASQLGSAD